MLEIYLQGSSLLRTAIRKAKEGLEVALRYLRNVKRRLINEYEEKKKLIISLGKSASKSITRKLQLAQAQRQPSNLA